METVNGDIKHQESKLVQDEGVHLNGEMNGSTDLDLFKTQKTKLISCDEPSDKNLDSINTSNKISDSETKENVVKVPISTSEVPSINDEMEIDDHKQDNNPDDKKETSDISEVENKDLDSQENKSEPCMDVDEDSPTINLDDSPLKNQEPIKSNENGEDRSCSSPEIEEIDEVKNNKTDDEEDTEERSDSTPSKSKKKRILPAIITPRRSSRNLSRVQKSYIEKEDREDDNVNADDDDDDDDDDDPDIEVIPPEDPLAVPSPEKERDISKSVQRSSRKTTIVVNDTKRLVEIAAGTKNVKGGKKEPTLVIIDTNSILSGRGPVPVSSTSVNSPSSSFSVMPVNLPSQGMYSTPRNSSLQVTPAPKPQPQILPSLTDDMYVVEAPSFIVPYVYEKPPLKPLKDFLAKLGEEIKKMEMEEKQLKKAEEKKATDSKNKDLENAIEEKDKEKSSDDIKEIIEKDVKEKSETDKNENTSEDDDERKTDKIVKISESIKENGKSDDSSDTKDKDEKMGNYFDNPLGKFFIQIGTSLVQEYVQTDLLRVQKRKRDREMSKGLTVTDFPINSLIKNLELSKENNEPYHLEHKKCEFCNFKTESSLVMAQHLETPHMRNYVYRCNFCPLEVRSPHDILFHMEAEHNVRGRLERAPAYHQCPSCLFEDNQKGKLTRHLLSCTKKFKPDRNLEPPLDWEPPAKIPRLTRNRPSSALASTAYQALAAAGKTPQMPLLPKLIPAPQSAIPGILSRGRGRPPMHSRMMADSKMMNRSIASNQLKQSGLIYRPTHPSNNQQVLLPTSYQLTGNQMYQVVGDEGIIMTPLVPGGLPRLSLMPQAALPSPTPFALVPSIAAANNASTIQSTNNNKSNPAAKLLQQPSISITPLPRQPAGMVPQPGGSNKPPGSSSKTTFVICEICDGYIKDLEQLRNHMQWIHKVKIHPKMIYNRPPLNCQKCQFRFFTDQGLERHLLGSHGLVTSSMQEAANKGKDGGRCPVCGRVYQWKLLNHVARDHSMTLKPAHLSYKCTVCTATFGMYKQFENHVYSAHSIVAKRVMDKKTPPMSSSRSSSETLLKPLKINDEITIIPQPARPRPGSSSRSSPGSKPNSLDDPPVKNADPTTRESREESLSEVKARLRRRKSLEISQVDAPDESPVESMTDGQL